ncbi:hypothetical protein ACFDTO_35435 [Microbacteriaceae bacterium 4G12]
MKKKIIWVIILFVLLFSYYEVIFRTKTVSYMGESRDWFIEINSKLIGLNGSYSIEVRYKGKNSIQYADFNIYPHFYNVGYSSFDKNGYFYWKCKDDCGYYGKDSKLLFFIVWKEGNDSEEKMQFIDLRRIPSKRWR